MSQIILEMKNIEKRFSGVHALKSVNLELREGEVHALMGENGAGKSTLIKVLAGITKPDSGNRAVQKDCRIAYLPQSGLTHHGSTLKEEADKAFEFGYELQRKIDEIGEQLKSNPANTKNLVERQAELITELDESGWHRREAAAESVLIGLGFSRSDFELSAHPEIFPLAALALCFCSSIRALKASSSIERPASSAISRVRSMGKPKVS